MQESRKFKRISSNCPGFSKCPATSPSPNHFHFHFHFHFHHPLSVDPQRHGWKTRKATDLKSIRSVQFFLPPCRRSLQNYLRNPKTERSPRSRARVAHNIAAHFTTILGAGETILPSLGNMPGPQVYFTLPTLSLWPDQIPAALPPPVQERSFRSPFGIDPWLYNFALKPEIPVYFAINYIGVVFLFNAYNRRRGWKPWWIARQRPFQWFVVIHNTLLTIYSVATFLAMIRMIAHIWPGLDNDAGSAGIADALCKMHGPRGLGDAAAFNTTINIWEAKNTFIKLGYDGNPDPTDVGRLWNEGLAFWGWMFYVSKFYEVLDTFIILSKGKRSATLQTYHHSGAMLCMWAGIRFMSPPIWMFVFVNSFIHALMVGSNATGRS